MERNYGARTITGVKASLQKMERENYEVEIARSAIDSVQDYLLISPQLIDLCRNHPGAAMLHSSIAQQVGIVFAMYDKKIKPTGEPIRVIADNSWNVHALDRQVINFGRRLLDNETLTLEERKEIEKIVREGEETYTMISTPQTRGQSSSEDYLKSMDELWESYIASKEPIVKELRTKVAN